MLKVCIDGKYSKVRCDVIKFEQGYVARSSAEQDVVSPSGYHVSKPIPLIDYFYVTLVCVDNKSYTFKFYNRDDMEKFIDELIVAEEESDTFNGIKNFKDYESYLVEKELGGTHEAFPGCKIHRIKVDSDFDSNFMEY